MANTPPANRRWSCTCLQAMRLLARQKHARAESLIFLCAKKINKGVIKNGN